MRRSALRPACCGEPGLGLRVGLGLGWERRATCRDAIRGFSGSGDGRRSSLRRGVGTGGVRRLGSAMSGKLPCGEVWRGGIVPMDTWPGDLVEVRARRLFTF